MNKNALAMPKSLSKISPVRRGILGSLWLAIILYSAHVGGLRHFALAQEGILGVQALRSSDPAVRVSAAKLLLANWQRSLKDLVEAVNGFDGKGSIDDLPKEDLDFFTRVTDVLRSIVVNNPPSIQRFRELDDAKTSRPLIWAARSGHRDLRVNSTFILANVADNTNVCIILHHLREKDISADGIVNLLQVVIAVSSYVYKENFEDAKKTLDELGKNLETRKENIGRTLALIAQFSKRLDASINKDEPLPAGLSFCKTDEAKKL